MSEWLYQKTLSVDWAGSFIPHLSLLEIFVRGTLIYCCLFFLLRFTRRHSGEINTSDVLVIALIADAVQNGMAGDYKSITEGVCLAATIFFWSWFFEWLPVRFPRVRSLLVPAVSVIVRDGQVDQTELQRGLMTIQDLEAQLRLQGVEAVDDVVRARIEANGRISIQRRP